jgi:Rrf2 family iron-sulfur cluster assembly transcriptional regulator
MAMVDIALNGEGKPVSISDIAKRQELDPGYLEQIFIKLKTAGLISSFRGARGGYKLTRSAAETRIDEIMVAVEEDIKATRCAGNGVKGCMHDRSMCLTHHLWKSLENHVFGYLRSITIEDVCLDGARRKLRQCDA